MQYSAVCVFSPSFLGHLKNNLKCKSDYGMNLKVPKGNVFRKYFSNNWQQKKSIILAKFWVPVHSMNVKQHRSAGVGHICAVHSTGLAPRQTLLEHKHTQNVSQLHIRPNSYNDHLGRKSLFTHMSQESTVPNMAR